MSLDTDSAACAPAKGAPAFPLTDKDLEVLSLTDEQFVPLGWEDLKEIIGTRRHQFFRGDLAKYYALSSFGRKAIF